MPALGTALGIPFLRVLAFYPPLYDALQWIWKFVSPATGSDKSGNGLDLDYVGNACLAFDGVSDYVDSGVAAPTANTDSIDIEVQFIMPDVTLGLGYGVIGSGTYDNAFGIMCLAGQSVRIGVRGSSGIAQAIFSDVDAGTIVTARLQWDGAELIGTVNGSAQTDTIALTGNISEGTSIKIGSSEGCYTTQASYFEGTIFYAKSTISGKEFTYTFAEDSGGTAFDIAGNGNDGTLSGTIATMRTTDDDAPASNIANGYSLYEHATSDDLLVPYGDDGNPLTITPPAGYTKTADNPPCGLNLIHNRAESLLRQKAENTEFLDNPFWSADGINYDGKSIEDILAHYNFDDNIVFKWDEDCFVSNAVTWPIDYQWTPRAYLQIVEWLGTVCGAGNLEPELTAEGDYTYNVEGGIVFQSP
jgi:hypothetical protein